MVIWVVSSPVARAAGSMDAASTAGPRGSYIYHAKAVSTEISDVAVNSPEPGVVKLYVLMDDGTLATEEIKAADRKSVV